MKKEVILTPIILLVTIISLVVYAFISTHNQELSPQRQSQATSMLVTTFSHILVIVEENKPAQDIINNSSAPYLNSLMQRYALATKYNAITHPSLPNYLALTSGTTSGVTNDCTPPSAGCEVSAPNIADRLEASNLTWRAYAESMPEACYGYNSGHYATRHNPFVYYTDIINNNQRCSEHVVPFTHLSTDLQSTESTPNFALIIPDTCNDMHDCSVAAGDSWLANEVPHILQSPAFTSEHSLLIITWDEGDTFSNTIATVFVGPYVKQAYRSSTAYDHYALLHTIEANWRLAPLTINDGRAPLMNEFFK